MKSGFNTTFTTVGSNVENGFFSGFPYKNMGGSLLFNGSTQALTVPASADWAFRTNDFTIEWWQYQTDNNAFPRIFTIGNYPTTMIGISIESGNFFFWHTSTFTNFGSVGTYKNTWVHFAISRNGTDLRLFKNGVQIGTTQTNNADINDSATTLNIAREAAANTHFGGYITNLHIAKGTALYTANFSLPTAPTLINVNSKLLLLASNSGLVYNDVCGKTITNINAPTWSTTKPF